MLIFLTISFHYDMFSYKLIFLFYLQLLKL